MNQYSSIGVTMEQQLQSETKRPLDEKPDGSLMKKRKVSPEKSREIRLAQNRKAARESRKRKKAMVEELQRSLIFFSKANTTLKQQNDDLTRRLLEARAQVEKIERMASSNTCSVESDSSRGKMHPTEHQSCGITNDAPSNNETSGSTFMYQPRNALELLSSIASPQPASVALQRTLPLMQPGATMQEMANFQQAASAAMQAAAQGLGTFQITPMIPSSSLGFSSGGMNATK